MTLADVRLIEGDCREVLATLPEGSVDAVVTDPPYGLVHPRTHRSFMTGASDRPPMTQAQKESRRAGFMGKKWDSETPGVETWQVALRVLRPGGYAAIFGGTRTYHRLACAVEDAGFEIRDCIMWLYGSGFPKGKGCLKPAYEPILLTRKPGPRVLPLGIDECRIPGEVPQVTQGVTRRAANGQAIYGAGHDIRRAPQESNPSPLGRWPANLTHDGSEEVLEAFAAFGSRTSGSRKAGEYQPQGFYGNAIAKRPVGMERPMPELQGDTGTAARFFYCAKASRRERGEGNLHPTVKPLALMEWLVRLVCPEGGTVLDPFAGSGTTAVACRNAGRGCIAVERDPAYFAIAEPRLAEARAATPLFQEPA